MIDGENLAPVVEFDIPALLGHSAVSLQIKSDGPCTIFNRGGDPIPAVVVETSKDGRRFIPGSGIRMVTAKTPKGYLGTTIIGAEEGTTITVVGTAGQHMDPVCRVFIAPGQ